MWEIQIQAECPLLPDPTQPSLRQVLKAQTEEGEPFLVAMAAQ